MIEGSIKSSIWKHNLDATLIKLKFKQVIEKTSKHYTPNFLISITFNLSIVG